MDIEFPKLDLKVSILNPEILVYTLFPCINKSVGH